MDPREELAAATKRYRRTEKAHDDSRRDVVEKVIAALRSGMSPTETTDLSPFTGSHVRKLARDAGIKPSAPGPKPRKPPKS